MQVDFLIKSSSIYRSYCSFPTKTIRLTFSLDLRRLNNFRFKKLCTHTTNFAFETLISSYKVSNRETFIKATSTLSFLIPYINYLSAQT